jgi:zinc transport system substrate-binding protein
MRWHNPRIFIVLGFAAIALLAFSGLSCTKVSDPWADMPGPPRVVVSFPPLYCFVKNIGGDDVGVITLCENTGPHQYEFNPRDSLVLKKADLFLANGLGLDRFADKLAENRGNAGYQYVELAEELPEKLLRDNEDEHDPHHDHANADHHHDGKHDPHVWLGIPQAINMVGQIRDLLKAKDPAHAEGYDKRAAAYVKKLEGLHADGQALLKDKQRDIISMHESLGYFADSFGLKVIGSIEPQPGSEPNAVQLKDLVKAAKENKVQVIAVEPQYPEGTAKILLENLKKDVSPDASLVVVDPLETANKADLTPDWYERKMRENLTNLAQHLK